MLAQSQLHGNKRNVGKNNHIAATTTTNTIIIPVIIKTIKTTNNINPSY